MALKELKPQVDYFYCWECKKHVPCIRLEPGVWDVQCARCVGECMLCDCHLAGYCLGKGQARVKTHMYVIKTVEKG